MYCVNCGVELKDSEKICPLCKTRVFHPDIPLPKGEGKYPEFVAPTRRFNRIGALIIVTFMFLIPLIICLLIDLRLNGRVLWSGYVIGGLILGYAFFVLPFWFKRPNPVVFVPIDFTLTILFLLYMPYDQRTLVLIICISDNGNRRTFDYSSCSALQIYQKRQTFYFWRRIYSSWRIQYAH